MTEGLSSSRIIDITTEEELEKLDLALKKHLIANDFEMDKTTESWLDSEFNRIYVTYAYPDVTKVN